LDIIIAIIVFIKALIIDKYLLINLWVVEPINNNIIIIIMAIESLAIIEHYYNFIIKNINFLVIRDISTAKENY
jgi:hypothetical protein